MLGGCAPKANTFAPYCPSAKRLPDASQVSVFRPGAVGSDITDMVLQGRIVNLSGSCKNGDDLNTVAVDAATTFVFTRGPAMQGRVIDVPFLFTVSRDEDIREQETLVMRVSFPSNVDTVTLTSEPIHMVFPVSKTTSAASYSIWAAFQLTPEQLERNRQQGLR
jgi:hypothetical protein